ncbi:MAG: hypothetical protein EON86_07365 [Brevundimonas sp.]|nr:MAG: hypothetical protein EON86_07365 [Brevundimonas sp.]
MLQIVISGLLVVGLATFLYVSRNPSGKKKVAASGKGLRIAAMIALAGAGISLLGAIVGQSGSRYPGLVILSNMEGSPKYVAVKTYFPGEYRTLTTPLMIAPTQEEAMRATGEVNRGLERLVARQLRLADDDSASNYLVLMSGLAQTMLAAEPRSCGDFYVGARFDGAAAFGEQVIVERERILGGIVTQTATRPGSQASMEQIQEVTGRVNNQAFNAIGAEQGARLEGFFDTGVMPGDDAGATALCHYMAQRLTAAKRLPPSEARAFVQGVAVLG